MTTTLTDKWHLRFLRLAREVSTWSKDPSTKVGCVIVSPDRRVVSLGFNGLPAGVRDSADRLADREVKLALTIHAEENALLFAKGSVADCTAYVTRRPCSQCAAKLIQSGIREVCYLYDEDFETRWADSLKYSRLALSESGVTSNPFHTYHLEF